MQIIPLSEGAFTIDQTKEFVPFNKDTDDLQSRSRGSLLVEIQPFLLITEKDIILLDSGLGFCGANDILQIHQNLLAHDIEPMQVTKVLMSHLHKDHAGGLVKFDKMLNRYFLSFPNATHYINKQELELARKGDNPSYKPEKLEPLYNSDQLVLLEEEGSIDNYIQYALTGAHSPNHLVFWIEEHGEKIFFGGDDAPQLKQMKNKFIAKYDYDGKKTMELRQSWWQKGKEEDWTFLFYHDIQVPFAKNA